MNNILLFSGGLDSFIAYFYLNKPKAVYVHLHSIYSQKELDTVIKLSKIMDMDLTVDTSLNLSPWEESNANIPMRNMFLLMVGSYYGDEVYLIVQQGETNIPDRTPEFFKSASSIINYLWSDKQRDIHFNSPFWEMTKVDMVKWYLDQGLDPELLLQTVSCYSSEQGQCGQCSSCFRRWIALEHNGLTEEYNHDITKYKEIPNYVQKMKNGEYDAKRTMQTKKVLKKFKLWY